MACQSCRVVWPKTSTIFSMNRLTRCSAIVNTYNRQLIDFILIPQYESRVDTTSINGTQCLEKFSLFVIVCFRSACVCIVCTCAFLCIMSDNMSVIHKPSMLYVYCVYMHSSCTAHINQSVWDRSGRKVESQNVWGSILHHTFDDGYDTGVCSRQDFRFSFHA